MLGLQVSVPWLTIRTTLVSNRFLLFYVPNENISKSNFLY